MNDKSINKRQCIGFLEEMWVFFCIGIKQQKAILIVTTMFSMAIPFGVLLMVRMMPINVTKETAVLFISGNMVTSISNLCITTLAQLLIGIRAKHGFEHMATLPISKWTPLLGILLSSSVSTIPALIIMPILGQLIFGIKITINVAVIFMIGLSIALLTGIGAILGTCSDNYEISNVAATITMFFVMFATPVYYSLESLPKLLQYIQRLLPFSYILEAIRVLMKDGRMNSVVYRDIIVLLFYGALIFLFTRRNFNWKQRQ